MALQGPGPARSAPPSGGSVSLPEIALFLDVDGTLLEIAPTPDEVVVGEDLIVLLRALSLRSNGAVAFVSGRSIATLDSLFQPLLLPTAGLHGFERRSASGAYMRKPLPSGLRLFKARETLRSLADREPGLLLEDKRFSLALHYRKAPHLEPRIVEEVTDLVARLGSEFELLRGRRVVEIRPAVAHKAAAIAEFMDEPPFHGRRPVFLGDDVTDECAFELVNRLGGLSLGVGVTRESSAQAHLPTVNAARMWLRRLLERRS
jgi:trehalose 6-phosphate phosphatase